MIATDLAPTPAAASRAPTAVLPLGPRGFIIPQERIVRAVSTLPDDARDAILWLANHCRAKGIHHKDIAPKLKAPDGEAYSHDSVYHLFTGGRSGGALANMVEAVERYRRVEDLRSEITTIAFIETNLTRKVFRYCEKLLARPKIGFIFGETQIGKTTPLEEFARQNPGTVIYVRMGAGGTLGDLQDEIIAIVGGGTKIRGAQRRRKIFGSFDSRMLLIVDECQEAFDGARRHAKGLKTLNFIREIHDRKKCAVLLCGTDELRDALLHCSEERNLRQLRMRAIAPLQFPGRPDKVELDQFSSGFGLDPAPDQVVGAKVTYVNDAGVAAPITASKNALKLETDVVAKYGLGRWLCILQDAADTAREKKRPLTWGFVVGAWALFQRMEKLDREFKQEEAA